MFNDTVKIDPVRYKRTNENLDSIIIGLKPCFNDAILAVCGSGDQIFALSEYAGHVTAIDVSSPQIEYAQSRMEMIRDGNYETFLYCGVSDRIRKKIMRKGIDSLQSEISSDVFASIKYFSREGRLDTIRKNVDKIRFIHSDIFNCENELLKSNIKLSRYNKIYFSNAFQYYNHEYDHKYLNDLINKLDNNTLLYLSKDVRDTFYPERPYPWRLDEKLTNDARSVDTFIWRPIVMTVNRKLTRIESYLEKVRAEKAQQVNH